MADIATVILFDPAKNQFTFDWYLNGPDLLSDEGLGTAIAISLFTEGEAHVDDALEEGEDGGGWWGDLALASDEKPDRTGSRLWLINRKGRTAAERCRYAKDFATEALQWLLDDEVAQGVDVTARIEGDRLDLTVIVSKRSATGQPVILKYSYAWTATLTLARDNLLGEGGLLFAQAQTVLTDEDGAPLLTEDGQQILL